jgi:Domain of unknown function (DUF4352)
MTVVESHGTTRPLRRTIALAVCALLLSIVLSGCAPKSRIFQIGEKIQVGGIVYTVMDVEWAAQLDAGGAAARAPQNRFLVVHLSINNASSKEVTLPLLNVVDPSGAEHLELSDGQGVVDWLGILRPFNPAETKEGRIVFDVPVANYNLRLTDGTEQEKERTELVALPPAPKAALDSPLLNQPKQD